MGRDGSVAARRVDREGTGSTDSAEDKTRERGEGRRGLELPGQWLCRAWGQELQSGQGPETELGGNPGLILSPRAAQTGGAAVGSPLTGCVTSGKLLSLCELQVSHL